jgi:PAS domain S-box-containing protein
VKPKILVVDDNEALAENIAELFEDAGATANIVSNAADADQVARAVGFDLAIIDLRLPGTSGVDLLPSLKRSCPDGEVVLITGNATLDTAIEAVRQGVFAYVQKPFEPDALLALGQRALAQVSLKREREALARELAHSEAVHRGVVETAPVLIVGIDEEDNVEFVNRFAAKTFGWRPRDARGRRFVDIAAADADRSVLESALRAARLGAPRPEQELGVSAKDGAARVVRWTVIPLRAEAAGPLVLAIGQDVTERIELEKRTAQSEAMATMGTLTAGLAHEIRNPLNAAKLQLELLVRTTKKVDDEGIAGRLRERVGIVQEELSRLSAMLDDFLALARPRGLEKKAFALLPLVAEVLALEGPVAHNHAVQVGVEPGDFCGVEVIGDRAKVKQVLVNLIGNSVDAMHAQKGGLVRVSARKLSDGLVEIAVTDTGPGVADEVSHHIFKPFVSTKEAGTGLGLAIVKKIVLQHGGEIEVGDRPGGGASFTITLPLRETRPG